MKKNKLYTVNKSNKRQLNKSLLETNIYDIGGDLKPISISAMYSNPTFKTPEKLSFSSNTSTPTTRSSSSSNWASAGKAATGVGLEMAGNIGQGEGFERGLYDRLDPTHYLAGGRESGVGNAMGDVGVGLFKAGVTSGNPILMGAGAGAKVLGSLTNAAFGIKTDKKKLEAVNKGIEANKNFISDASNFDDIVGPTATVNAAGVYKGGWFSGGKARRKNEALQKEATEATQFALNSVENNIDNIISNQMNTALSNFAAFGGPLDMLGGSAIGYELANKDLGIKELSALSKNKMVSMPNSFNALNTFADGGSIHIKPENRGKFTALKERTGKSATWFKEHGTPAQKKMATFALNAAKWKHANGGTLSTNGADWSNGLTYIGNGGLHETNPMEGVLMGVDNEGIPNLVEQGEVIFNDYVFSNRLRADRSLLEAVNLPRTYAGLTFADIANKLNKESKERPNDPISKRGLVNSITKLQQAQEIIRQKDMAGQEGSKKGKKFSTGGTKGKYNNLLDAYNAIVNTNNSNEDVISLGDNSFNLANAYTDTYLTNPGFLGFGDNSTPTTQKVDTLDKGKTFNLSDLRYAPILGAAIGFGQNIFSKPDYSNTDTLLAAANNMGNYLQVTPNYIGNYLTYKPLNSTYYADRLDAQAGATRRAIMNSSSPSKAAALLAADYNAQGRLGEALRQGEETNWGRYLASETFNRGTNQYNSELGLKAAMANQEAALRAGSARYSGIAQAMNMRDAIDARRAASVSANLTNFFNSLGDVGREEYSRNMIMSNPALYYSIDRKGNVTYKNGYDDLSEAEKKEVRDAASKAKKKAAKGGYLTIKKGGK